MWLISLENTHLSFKLNKLLLTFRESVNKSPFAFFESPFDLLFQKSDHKGWRQFGIEIETLTDEPGVFVSIIFCLLVKKIMKEYRLQAKAVSKGKVLDLVTICST